MNTRRASMLAVAATAAAIQFPTAAQADPWSFFSWARPITVAGDWAQPTQPAAPAVSSRRQRVAVAAPAPVSRPPQRIIIVGVGF